MRTFGEWKCATLLNSWGTSHHGKLKRKSISVRSEFNRKLRLFLPRSWPRKYITSDKGWWEFSHCGSVTRREDVDSMNCVRGMVWRKARLNKVRHWILCSLISWTQNSDACSLLETTFHASFQTKEFASSITDNVILHIEIAPFSQKYETLKLLLKSWGSVRSILCFSRLHLFYHKYDKNIIVVKHYNKNFL